jgi:hypothetical protein
LQNIKRKLKILKNRKIKKKLNNGATELQANEETQNFEYKI